MLTRVDPIPMRYYEFRDGDIVEVSSKVYGSHQFKSFPGIVDSRKRPRGKSAGTWVWVRRTGHLHSGGWHANQCRLLLRPKAEPALPIPDNIVLSGN